MKFLARLDAIEPYDFALTMRLLRHFPTPVTDIVDGEGWYWRALHSGEGLALLRVSPERDVYLAASLGAIDREGVLRDLRHILAVDADPRPFYAAAQSDPALWAIVGPLSGIRWLRTPTVWEALVMLIIEQHIAWKTAQRAQRVLVEWADQRIHCEGVDYYTYPTPAQIAAATLDDLKPLKITTRRIQMLIAIAQQVKSGALDLEALRHLPHEDAYQQLMALKGVGHWTAANVIQRAFGVFAYVPDSDVALQAAANHYFNGARGRLSPKALRDLYSQFGVHAPAAAYHTIQRLVFDRYPENTR